MMPGKAVRGCTALVVFSIFNGESGERQGMEDGIMKKLNWLQASKQKYDVLLYMIPGPGTGTYIATSYLTNRRRK